MLRTVHLAVCVLLCACSSSSAPGTSSGEGDTSTGDDTATVADEGVTTDAAAGDTTTEATADTTTGPSGENTRAACSDGKDNDGDGYYDCGDKDCCPLIDCSSRPTTYCGKQETNPITCADGKDNDGDGYIDCEDGNCCAIVDCVAKAPTSYCAKKASAVSENTATLCNNGKDDDGDGFIDCNDKSCCGVVDCTSKPTTFCGGGGCKDPKYPVFCPAKGDVGASCWTAGTICSSVTNCGGVYKSCSTAGYVVDCAASACVPPPGSTADHHVNCTWADRTHTTAVAWCACTPTDSNTGPVKVDGKCEKDPSFAPMRCCASSGYPKSGTCGCFLSQPWGCMGFGSLGSCSCDYFWDAKTPEYLTSVCNDVPDPDGTPWLCCFDKVNGHCGCDRGKKACDTGETVVSDCASESKLGLSAFKGCAAGEVESSGCSGSPAGDCTKDSDCGGSCAGDDPVCCSSCSGGHCKSTCCSSSGICY